MVVRNHPPNPPLPTPTVPTAPFAAACAAWPLACSAATRRLSSALNFNLARAAARRSGGRFGTPALVAIRSSWRSRSACGMVERAAAWTAGLRLAGVVVVDEGFEAEIEVDAGVDVGADFEGADEVVGAEEFLCC